MGRADHASCTVDLLWNHLIDISLTRQISVQQVNLPLRSDEHGAQQLVVDYNGSPALRMEGPDEEYNLEDEVEGQPEEHLINETLKQRQRAIDSPIREPEGNIRSSMDIHGLE